MHAGKAWGSTATVYSGAVDVEHLDINADGFCSIHMHKHKFNLFYVIKGLLEVRVEKADQGLVDITLLRDGQSMVVAPGQYHQFIARTEVVGLEVYFTELSEDILRKSSGGADVNGKKTLLL
jgi:mannose-6-phosphate isomerase-like protein (cupin superfamily)